MSRPGSNRHYAEKMGVWPGAVSRAIAGRMGGLEAFERLDPAVQRLLLKGPRRKPGVDRASASEQTPPATRAND